ncbi:hypothetical protein BH23THE1_BH23THE1_32750 [soil metagenome]
MGSYATVHITRTYMMKGEQQKILYKGTNNDKVNALITLLYPLNKIKFNTGKTRNSSDDFINHLKVSKRHVLKRSVK